MHLTDIVIDEIVKVDDLPCHAIGRATFTNGRQYHFTAMFAQAYGDSRVFVRRHAGEEELHPGSRAARAIHDRLGFGDIATRERAAIGAFEYERVAACEELMMQPRRDPSPPA